MTIPDALRSKTMRAVRSKNTKPELLVKRIAHALGYRFRLHRKDLPGSPDLVFPRFRCVIFVHGCFWHGHDCKRGARVPKENADYWQKKIARNKARDDYSVCELERQGWRVLVLWECELRQGREAIEALLHKFLHEATKNYIKTRKLLYIDNKYQSSPNSDRI